jgi:phosphatidylglycerophosphate synthase
VLAAGLTPVPSRAAYLRRWSELHGGYDPGASRLVGPWLWLVYTCARPLARLRVPPDAVTALGLVTAAAAAGVARAGGGWLFAAAALVVASALVDSLDGAVAVLTERATPFGYVLDSVVDRCADLLYILALWWVGAPAGACVAAGAAMLLQEYLRARAGAGGMTEVGVVTVWERPTRVIVTATFLLGAAVYRTASSTASASWATDAAWVWLGLGAVGLVQLTVVVRRRLR